MERIYTPMWLEQPREVRAKIAQVFDIERTGPTEVRNETVLSDGYSNKDLEAITADKMIAYVGSTESFSRLWELTLAKVHYELHPPTIEIGVGEIVPPTPVEAVELPEEIKEEQNAQTTTDNKSTSTKKSK